MAQRVRRNSEWADAFFPSTDTFWRSRTTQGEEVVHSGLAPIYPSLPYDRYDGDAAPWSNPVRLENPWDTSDYGDYGGPIPKPSDGELDRLFYGERLQQHTFMGLRSWQAGVLSREIYDGNISLVRDKDPVEAWESFQKQMITVDESMWPNFWRKERWFDLRVNPLDSIKNPHSDWRTARPLYWSVDNPIIWSHLRVAIELAFRQLCALICSDSPWFDALVFVDAQPWLHKRDGTATKFDTGFTGDNLRFRQDKCTDPGAYISRLEQLNTGLRLSFHADHAGMPSYGFTAHSRALPKRQFSTIHVFDLRVLCDTRSSVSDKISAMVNMSDTILHEFMHSTSYGKTVDELEPYVEDEFIAELGESMETQLYGGSFKTCPNIEVGSKLTTDTPPARSGNLGGTVLHIYLEQWPNWKRAQTRSLGSVENRAENSDWRNGLLSRRHLPLWWSSALLTQEVWNSAPDDGHMDSYPMLVSYEAAYGPEERIYTPQFQEPRVSRHPILRHSIIKFDKRLQAHWLERMQQWELYRDPWYEPQYENWQSTPWSWITSRQWISEFREAHSQQKWRECQFTAMMFVESCWKLHLDNFSKDRHEHNSILWVFVCVSQLMLASLPIQSSSETVQGPSINVQYHPSLEAAATGTAQFTFNYDQIYRISKTYRKTPLDGPNPNPREFLQSFQAVYNVEKDRPKVPQAWIDALARAADAIEVARRQNPSPTIHAPFEFVIPPYESSPVWNQYKYDPGIGSLRSPFNSPLLAKMALASEESQGEPSKYTTSTLGFFTVGEITDHLTTRDAWVVESDGDGGFDVYNITDAVRGAGWSDRQYRSLLVWSPTMCPMLTPYDIEADKIRREFGKSNRRIGKQTLEFYPEEIAENNGQDSKPLWVVLRGWVYDISKFPFSDAPERELLLRAVRGEFTTQPPSNEDDLPEDLMRRLSYHRCGLVKFKKGRRAFLQPMTLSSLRWHDNPSARVLIAIDQTIYDITEYIESHPGGRSLLLTAGGKDQTAEFYRSHQKNTLQDFADLVYARLVPEIDLTDIQADQIVLHDWVYDVKDLNDPEIHPYLGTDASAILTASPSSAASVGLTRLYLDRSRVVAKILATAAKRRRLPTITEGEIRANYADVDSLNGAFVTVSSDVYDVTDIMKYPEFYRYTIPRGYAGEPLLDAQLAAWLASEHAERRVGRLVSGAATHEFPRHINKPSLRDWIAQVSSLSV